jgi:sugar/nucleoside kinase (ribokinase family)
MLNAMQERGIDTSRVIHNPNQQTGFSVILNRGADRAIITYMGTINTLQANQISDDFLQQGRHLHIASYFLQTALQPGILSLFSKAHQFGLTTSLDVNWDPSEKWQGVSDILPEVDVFLPNAAEALSITGTHSLKKALKKLGEIVSYVVIKTGAKGGVAKHGENIAEAAALPVEVVDTIGAGDSFNAGFLYGFLHKWDLQKSLQLGVICGSLNTTGQGGTDNQPALQQAMEYIH